MTISLLALLACLPVVPSTGFVGSGVGGVVLDVVSHAGVVAQGNSLIIWWPRILALGFAFCFGACVGSFLNVVIYRLPAGLSLISPPSRCPTCGARLRFFRDNLPILGWLLLRGRCRYCGDRISPQYMLIELFVAVLFSTLTILYFFSSPSTPYWGDIGGPWWYFNGIKALPAFIAVLIMFSGLIAMTMIDARTFTIPLVIPLWVIVVAMLAWPIQAMLPIRTPSTQPWPIPGVSWTGFWTSVGGIAGVLISVMLMRLGVLRYSFHDYEEYVKDDEPLADYPHARREMLVELLFLLPALTLMVAGWLLGRMFSGEVPLLLNAVGASLAGYLVGGGLIWGIRILGTLGFGREAMGMGDVHLLAAVGAVMGYLDVMFIFFAAAFVGIFWTALCVLLSRFNLKVQRELPYGPHLAVATLLIVFLHPVMYSGTLGPGIWSSFAPLVGPLFP